MFWFLLSLLPAQAVTVNNKPRAVIVDFINFIFICFLSFSDIAKLIAFHRLKNGNFTV
jgi:hypothetical protein